MDEAATASLDLQAAPRRGLGRRSVCRGGTAAVGASLALMLVVSAACESRDDGAKAGAGAPSQPAVSAPVDSRRSSITIGISQEPDTLWIPFKEMLAAEEIARPTAYTLTIFGEDWTLIPWAAESIPTVANGQLVLFEEEGAQKMRATWKIRPEFAWPDGKPLVGDDFVLAWKIALDPNQEVIDRNTASLIEKMEVKGEDRRTLEVTWKQPFAGYAVFRQHEAVPAHVVGPLYETQGGDLKKHPFGTRPLLAGAFTIEEWVPGSHIIAKANPHATGFLKPRLDRIIWRFIPKTNTLSANLASGTIDAISPIGMTFDQALELERSYPGRFDVHFTEGLVWEHVDFDLDNPILKDLRVRQALAHASDREQIVQELFAGKQPVAHATQPPRSRYHNPDVRKYPFDPARAGSLLDEAGWRMGERGVRMKDGKPLELTLMTTSGNQTREQVEALLQAQWRKIGVDLKIKNEPAKVLFGETLRRRKSAGLVMYAWTMDPALPIDTFWRCDNIPSEKNSWHGQNYVGWCDEEADRLLREIYRTLDDEPRWALGRTFEARWAEELPALPLYFRVDVTATTKGLKGWKPTGTLQPITWNAHEWEWK